jgi:mannitol/fructose-specific phosphotransferase system IIA component (Ntr-type)
MHLTDILTPQRIKIPLSASQKDAAIAEMVDLLAADGALRDRDKVLQAVLERERTRTTGIGSGLALPHGKSSGVEGLVMAVGRPAAPMDFESIDGKPVSLIFLLVSPLDMTGPHIQALARISRLASVDAVRNKLLAAKDAREMYDTIAAQEKTLG